MWEVDAAGPTERAQSEGEMSVGRSRAHGVPADDSTAAESVGEVPSAVLHVLPPASGQS